jgi:phenylacetate-CoA ligase
MKLTEALRSTSKKSDSKTATVEQSELKLFREVSSRVPAYEDFLKTNDVNPARIKTIDDFHKLPIVDKKNYLTKYPLADLCWDGTLAHSRIISVSSGSTGEPFFWPRGAWQDQEGGQMHAQLYREIFAADKKSTLIVICFSMGTWIAGSYTAASTIAAAEEGIKMNLVTPGIEKEEAVKAIKHLGRQYEQIIIAGFPPFTKDILDEGIRQGIRWNKLNVKFMWAGEAFSEEWRDYVLQYVGSKNPYFSGVNIYGSADAAMLGHETPVSILLRRILNRRPALRLSTFGSEVLPSIMQYDPSRRYFEVEGGEMVFSAYSGIPLLRYNIHDTGGILSYEEGVNLAGPAFAEGLKKHAIDPAPWHLPFIYLNGRKDFTATIYAVNIYTENIKAALVDPKMRGWGTGKFTMATRNKTDMDQYFEINIELAKGIPPESEYRTIASQTIITKLTKMNGEYRKLRSAIGEKADPVVHLIEFGDKEHFANGVKHRWVKR